MERSTKNIKRLSIDRLLAEFSDGIVMHLALSESRGAYQLVNDNAAYLNRIWHEIEHRGVDREKLMRALLADPRDSYLLVLTAFSQDILPNETLEVLRRIAAKDTKEGDKAKLRVQLLERRLGS